jgi:acetyl-CoA C-acetyltransferase
VAANYVRARARTSAVGAGVESISLVQMSGKMNTYRYTEEKLMETHPALWMPMIETADNVAERYNVSREAQDEYALRSQQLIAQAQTNGIFKDEIVPMQVKMKKVDKETGQESIVDYVVDRTSATGRRRRWRTSPSSSPSRARASGSPPATPPVVRRRRGRRHHGSQGRRRRPASSRWGGSWASRSPAASPTRWGSGPVFAVPRLLERHGLTVDDIDLWELNEAFASQCLYSRDRLGIDPRSTTSTAARSRSATPTA